MKIYIDTNTFPATPGVYADAEKTKPLPRVIPLVQGFRGTVQIAFLGELAPKSGDGVTLAMRPFGARSDILVTQTVAASTTTGEDGVAAVAEINLAVDTSALVEALGPRETMNVLCGVVVTDDAAAFPTRVEWQLVLSVSASALDNGVPPDISPSAAEQFREDLESVKTDIAENYVTKNTAQEISEVKTFTKGVRLSGANTMLRFFPLWDGEVFTRLEPTRVKSSVGAFKRLEAVDVTGDALTFDFPLTSGMLALRSDIAAADANVVHRSGTETITGAKLFSSDIFAKSIVFSSSFGSDSGQIYLSDGASHMRLTGSISVLPLGTKTAFGADAYGLSVSADGGLQLFGTHFLRGDIWTDSSLKIVANNVSLYSTDEAAIGFDYANKVVFRTMPNDGTEATYSLEAWQWDDDLHSSKSPSAGVKFLKPSQVSSLMPDSVLNMQEGDTRWLGKEIIIGTPVYDYDNGVSDYGNVVVFKDTDGNRIGGIIRHNVFPNDIFFSVSPYLDDAGPHYGIGGSTSEIYVYSDYQKILFPKKSGTVALDGDVVHLTGTETISGVKSFTGGIRVSSIASIAGTPIYDTTDSKGFNFKGIYTLGGYVSGGTNATSVTFFKQEDANTNWIDVTTLKEGGVALSDKYALTSDLEGCVTKSDWLKEGGYNVVVNADLAGVSITVFNPNGSEYVSAFIPPAPAIGSGSILTMGVADERYVPKSDYDALLVRVEALESASAG